MLQFKKLNLKFDDEGKAVFPSDKVLEGRVIHRMAIFTPGVGSDVFGNAYLTSAELAETVVKIMLDSFVYIDEINSSFFEPNDLIKMFKPSKPFSNITLNSCYLKGDAALAGKAVQVIFEVER